MKHFKTKIGLIIAVFTVGIFAVAFAQDWNGSGYSGRMMGNGMGYGRHMMNNGMMYGGHMMDNDMGYDGHMMRNGHHGYSNLSSEDAAALQKAQEEFYNETRGIRNKIQEKQLALNQELEKTAPDREKALGLQKELSKLETEFDQEVLAHRLDLRNTFPDNALSMGYGTGGYCW